MADFAVIIHPVNLDLIHIFDPGTNRLRAPVIRKVLEWTPSFYTCPIQGTRSLTGKEVEGHFIMCPLLPDQILNLNHGQDLVMKRVLEAAYIAESLGVKLLGLAAYVSLAGRKGVLVQRKVGIPVTTGSSYTIAIVVKAAFKACKQVGIRLDACKATVIGATGTIGSTCSAILSEKVRHLTLVARNRQRLDNFMLELKGRRGSASLEATNNIDEAVRDADLVILSTSAPSTLVNIQTFKPGAIICDVSQPRNVEAEVARMRQDILVIDGGVVKPPGEVNFNFNFGLAPGLAFACIAETMILALEERYECYSLGGNISLLKVQEIDALARKHGFQLAGLRSFNQEVTQERIEVVREARLVQPTKFR